MLDLLVAWLTTNLVIWGCSFVAFSSIGGLTGERALGTAMVVFVVCVLEGLVKAYEYDGLGWEP